MWDERGDPSNIVGMLIFHALRVFLIVTAIKMVQTMTEIMNLRADTSPEAQLRNYKMNINESAALVHACLIQALNASPLVNNVRQRAPRAPVAVGGGRRGAPGRS